MGSFLDCPKYENESKNESEINISNTCIERLTRKNGKFEKPPIKEDLTDDEWISHLKCLDDIHTFNNGLTIQETEELMESVEQSMGAIRSNVCSADKVIACLKKYPNCSIKCKHNVDEFMDCIKKSRIEIIKEKVEEENRCRQLEEEKALDIHIFEEKYDKEIKF